MKIGMILDHYFPPDERVEKEACALVENNHQLIILCLRKKIKDRQLEHYKGIVLHKVYIPYWIVKKLRALTNTIFNLYPYLWAYFIKKFIAKHQIEAIHPHDLYMFSSSILVRKLSYKNIPLIGDLHENYVEGLKHYRFANSFPGNILISIKKWQKSEIEWSLKMDYIITVIEEASKRYQSLGIPKERIHIVSNYVDTEEFLSQKENSQILEKFKDKFTLVYTGAFDLHRGLEIVVRALPEALKAGSDISLVLVGHGKNSRDLKNLAKNLGVLDHVFFEGWQKRENLLSYIKAADICLVPHLKTEHTDNTIPHKLFQYMLLKKPVIVSDCNPLVRIVQESDCGFIYTNDQPSELSKCIEAFYNAPDQMKKMGENGHSIVMEKYNWKSGQKELIGLYSKIQDSRGT